MVRLMKLIPEEKNRASGKGIGMGPFNAGLAPLPAVRCRLVGISKDSTGAIVPGATVMVYRTADRQYLGEVISDPVTGAYEFSVYPNVEHFVNGYKVGVPDLAGTTVNYLVGG